MADAKNTTAKKVNKMANKADELQHKLNNMQKAIDDVESSSSKPTKNKAAYTPNNVNLKSSYETNVAYGELEAYEDLQRKFDSSLFDYKSWANEEVKYTNMNSRQTQEKLRQCNDSYTLATISDIMTPLRDGISIETIARMWAVTQAVRIANPSFDMDVSRLTDNLRQAASDSMIGKANGDAVTAHKMEKVSRKAAAVSTELMGSEIERNMKQHTIDNMIMTPRQLAAIKLNFTEQCYVDMRSGVSSYEAKELRNQYDSAVEHIKAIASNSGFDMSVVAAEERYLAGLKIKVSPEYANVFTETADLGARMAYSTSSNAEDKLWAGEFKTLDGAEYSVGHHTSKGAFSPRIPHELISDGDPLDSFTDALSRRAKLFASVKNYLGSDDCEIKKGSRADAQESVDIYMEEYKARTISMLVDDGLASSKRAAKAIWDKSFSDVYSKTVDDYNKGTAEARELSDAFRKELKHSVNKSILQDVGVPIDEKNPDINAACESLKKFVDDESMRHTKLPDNRSGYEVLDDMRKNHFDRNVSSKDAGDLMLKVITNIEQGYNNRGTYFREKSFDNELNHDISKNQPASTHRDEPDIDSKDYDDEETLQPV